METKDTRRPDISKWFGNIEVGIWIKEHPKTDLNFSIMFSFRCTYRERNRTIKSSTCFREKDIGSLQEALNWVREVQSMDDEDLEKLFENNP